MGVEDDAKEFEMPEDSGGASGSNEGVGDGLSQGEATGGVSYQMGDREDEEVYCGLCDDGDEEGRRPQVARTAQRVSKQ